MGVGIARAGSSLEQGPSTEFRLTADDPFGEKEYGRSVAVDGDLVAWGLAANAMSGQSTSAIGSA
jgi:hypothetical protein